MQNPEDVFDDIGLNWEVAEGCFAQEYVKQCWPTEVFQALLREGLLKVSSSTYWVDSDSVAVFAAGFFDLGSFAKTEKESKILIHKAAEKFFIHIFIFAYFYLK